MSSEAIARVKNAVFIPVEYAIALSSFVLSLPKRAVVAVFHLVYVAVQLFSGSIFKPRAPRSPEQPTTPHGRIAVIGAGLTGISSAAHAVAHGFDVVIFEQSDKIGGIWSNVNATSGLQLNSLLYRFFPSLVWHNAFPKRDEILSEMGKIWREYNLASRTRFKAKVSSVRRARRSEVHGLSDPSDLKPSEMGHSRWIINDGAEGVFDAVVVCVGTCGEPNMVSLPGMPGHKERKHHKPADRHRARKDHKSHGHGHEQDSGSGTPSPILKAGAHARFEDPAHGRQPGQDEEARKLFGLGEDPAHGSQSGQDKKAKELFGLDEGSAEPHDPAHGSQPGQDEKAQKFFQLGEVHDAQVSVDSTSTDLGVWEKTKPRENAWDVGRNQVEKKEQGFPTPGEVFEVGQDPQEGGEDASLVHDGHAHTRKSKNGKEKQQDDEEERFDEQNGDKKAKGNGKADDGKNYGEFKGPIIHSSQLDAPGAPPFEGKTVVVIGGGASAVEAVETALAQGANKCVVLVRDDKWIIPRNIFIDTLIALQPFGREMPLSFLWEKFITLWNYYFVTDLTPAHRGLFESTPVINDEFLGHVRKGLCKYVRGDTERLTSRGVLVSVRDRNSKPGDSGEKEEFDADIVVLATGFKKPSVDFLEPDLFPEGYDRPNLYLQTFSTEDWSILMTNSAYQNAIGTVGHFHIGIYARILMTFLLDRNARPTPKDMKLWVDCVRFVKRGAKGGALGFFTYMELMIWLVLFHIFRLDRVKWLFFILQGWGVSPQEYRKPLFGRTKKSLA